MDFRKKISLRNIEWNTRKQPKRLVLEHDWECKKEATAKLNTKTIKNGQNSSLQTRQFWVSNFQFVIT